jgi:predicted nucleic acid-binding protein
LLHLARTANLPLLKVLAPAFLTPSAVVEEIRAKGPDDAVLAALQATSWISVVPPLPIPSEIQAKDLGAGESAVLAWCHAHPGTIAVLDDRRARELAESLRIPVIGTLGIVLQAKRKGIIPRARPIVEELVRQGMYLSKHVIDRALGVVGE